MAGDFFVHSWFSRAFVLSSCFSGTKKRLHQRKYFQPMQSSVFFNLEAKHFLTRKITEEKEPSVGFTSPLQR
jgi:hypothetical protein